MVKNAAKLVLFLSVTFLGLLVISGFLSLLQNWTNEALLFPPEYSAEFQQEQNSGKIVVYMESSIPVAFYISILLALNYAARRKIAYPAAFGLILVFVLALSGAAFFGLESLGKMGFSLPIKKPPVELAKPGFLLNQGTLSGYETAFLEAPQKPDGAVVLMSEGQPFNYQGQGFPVSRTRLPFFAEKRGVFTGINRDIEHSSQVFTDWFRNGFWSYGVYTGALAAFLLSLGCLVNISFWSLANLFFGALAFRGVFALKNFLNQGNIHSLLSSFAGKVIHPSLINPLIFFFLTILILLYSGLVYLARGRIGDG